MEHLSFDVTGTPRPQGSKDYLGRSPRGKPRFKETSPDVQAWRSDIRTAAEKAMNGHPPLDGPVEVWIKFRMPRPKSHYLPVTKSRPRPVLREDAPMYHSTTPDGDKLTRAVFDALTEVVFTDDKQVAKFDVTKFYGTLPGASIHVWAL